MSNSAMLYKGRFKCADWPHAIVIKQPWIRYLVVSNWIKTNLEKSQFRISYMKDYGSFNTLMHVGYHFKDPEDLLVLKLKFNLTEQV